MNHRHELDRFHRIDAQLQTDVEIDRQQPEPCQFCAVEEEVSPPLTRWQVLGVSIVWAAATAATSWLAGWWG